MTVAELIARLQLKPQDGEVLVIQAGDESSSLVTDVQADWDVNLVFIVYGQQPETLR